MSNTTYATPAQLRPRVNLAPVADPAHPTAEEAAKDAELQVYLNAAAATVDGKTRGYTPGYEAFSASAEETRYFDAPDPGGLWTPRRGRWTDYWAVIIDDNLTLTAVAWGTTTVDAARYQRTPANGTPKTTLRLRGDAYGTLSAYWAASQQLALTGTWGYSVTPPPGIVHLTLTLAERLYERTGRQPIDPTGISINPDLVLDRYLLSDLKLYARDVEIA